MPEPIGWVLYDDACGICRRGIPFLKGTLGKRGFAIAPLQSPWVAGKLGTSQEDLLFDLRLLLASGEQIRGADVYRYLMRRIWWAYPLYLLSVTPLLRKAFDLGYRTFADNRHWFSHACRLPPPDEAGTRSTGDAAMHSGSGPRPSVLPGEAEVPVRSPDKSHPAD